MYIQTKCYQFVIVCVIMCILNLIACYNLGVLEWSMVMAKKGRGWRWRGVCLEVKGKVNQETLARLLPSVSISQHLSFCYNQAFVGGYQTEHDDL